MRRSRSSSIFAAILALAPGAAAFPAYADTPVVAATAATPITIVPGCSYKTLRSGFGLLGNVELTTGHGYNFFTLTFTNDAKVAASEIDFQIDFGKSSRIVIPDIGTFASGAKTTTTFRDNGKGMIFSARPQPNDGSVMCTVVAAKFVDGTSYAAAPAPAASVTP